MTMFVKKYRICTRATNRTIKDGFRTAEAAWGWMLANCGSWYEDEGGCTLDIYTERA